MRDAAPCHLEEGLRVQHGFADVAVPVVEVERRALVLGGRRDGREERQARRGARDLLQAGSKVGLDGVHEVAVVGDAHGEATDERSLACDLVHDRSDGDGRARDGDRDRPVDRRHVDEPSVLRDELARPAFVDG